MTRVAHATATAGDPAFACSQRAADACPRADSWHGRATQPPAGASIATAPWQSTTRAPRLGPPPLLSSLSRGWRTSGLIAAAP
jgi:hypothetical protein